LLVVVPPLGVLALALAGGVLAFFRDPERQPADSAPPGCALAAADGTVSVVRTEDDDAGRERVRVGVFMNVTDVHVNRAPLPGRVTGVEHVPGGHLPAFSKRAERNERLHVDFVPAAAPDADDQSGGADTGDGNAFRVTLIAGTLARRCHGYVDPGDRVDRGERIGHIAFSSRVDVVLPPRFDRDDLLVEQGDTVRAGRTPLAADPAVDAVA
jgi:phosphatidylserine decarboxylase